MTGMTPMPASTRYQTLFDYLVKQGLPPLYARVVMRQHLEADTTHDETDHWFRVRQDHHQLGTEMGMVRGRALTFLDTHMPNHPRRAWFTECGPRGIDSSKERT